MGTLKQRIKTKLNEKGLSVHAFEKSAGLKQSAVQNILQGRSKRPRIDIIQTIARNLNCSVEELLGETELSGYHHTIDQSYSPPLMEENIPWDKELYLKTMETIIKVLKNQTTPFSRQDIITTIDEIYSYSAQGKKQQIDKQFAEWFLNKKIMKTPL